jgi:hypothetical protein
MVTWETGYLLVKRAGKYLCYNSFKVEWFWGPKHLSEKFEINDPRLKKFGYDEWADCVLVK